jgi:hypothetical protein
METFTSRKVLHPQRRTASSTHNQAVLILDDDLAFTVWLSQLIGEFGYQALPGVSCLEASSCIERFHIKVDIVLVNTALVGVAKMLRRLGRTLGPFRIVLIKSPSIDISDIPAAHATIEKPYLGQKISRGKFVANIRKALLAAPAYICNEG